MSEQNEYSVRGTILIGLAFCCINVAWSVYNAFVPVFLSRLSISTALIGLIMTFDNVAGLIFQPFFGKLSDRTCTPLGRRMPFLTFGVPVAAAGMLLIPLGAAAGFERYASGLGLLQSILPLMGCILLMNLAMSVYRAPAVALMPDATPPERRSEANGLINLMGGLGSAVAFYIGGKLFDLDERYPFWLAASLMVGTLVVMLTLYREPRTPFEAELRHLEDSGDKSRPRSLMPLLFAVFFWFCAYNAVETFYTLYAIERFGMTAGEAASKLLYLSGSYLVCAWPAGKLGARLGRRRAMVAGTAATLAVCTFQTLAGGVATMTPVLLLAGAGVALININSYPALIQMSGAGQTGRYTGYYYAFSFSASIASPVLCGIISDLAKSNAYLFYYATAMYAVSAICIMMVRRADVEAPASQRQSARDTAAK